jgi:WD40 repeat protein
MPSYHSVRKSKSRRRLSRFGLILVGSIATIIGTGTAIYWAYSKSSPSSIVPVTSPTTATPKAADTRVGRANSLSSTKLPTTGASTSKSKPKVPKVNLSYTLTGASSSVNLLAISKDGQTLVNSSDYSNVHIWNLSAGCQGKVCNIPMRTLPMYSPWVYSVAIDPDSRIAVIGGWQDIKIWNLNKGELLQTFPGHLGAVYVVGIAPNGQKFVSGGSDGRVKIWNQSTGKLLQTLTGHSDSVRSLAISPDSKTLVTGSSDTSIKIWNLGSGCTGETCKSATKNLAGHIGYISSLVISPDGKTLASGSADKTIKIWDFKTGKLNRTLSGRSGHSGAVLSVAISPDGKLLASGSADRTIKLWWLKTGQLLTTLTGHTDMVNSVAFSSDRLALDDGLTLVSGSSDKTIKVWQLK